MGTAQAVIYGLLVVLIAVGTVLGLTGLESQRENATRNEIATQLTAIAGRAKTWAGTPYEYRGESVNADSRGFEDFTFKLVDPNSGGVDATFGSSKYHIITATETNLSVDAYSQDSSVVMYLRIPPVNGKTVYTPQVLN